MALERIHYADGTYLEHSIPWGMWTGARALCPDGKVRTMKRIEPVASCMSAVTAAVNYKGKTVTGYVCCETKQGYDTATDDDPAIIKFFPYTYGKNGALFGRNNAPNPHK